MSNPTELPDLLPCPFCGSTQDEIDCAPECWFTLQEIGQSKYRIAEAWNRRAQPEGEAPQAEPPRMNTDESREYLIKFMEKHFTDRTYHRYIRGERGSVNLAGDFAWQMARALRMLERAPAATLSPLCGAQHAESGKEAAPIRADMKSLPRFKATPGAVKPGSTHGYPEHYSSLEMPDDYLRIKNEIQSGHFITIAQPIERNIVLCQGGVHEIKITKDGVIYLGEKVDDAGQLYKAMMLALGYGDPRAAQLDGGQEGSESNG